MQSIQGNQHVPVSILNQLTFIYTHQNPKLCAQFKTNSKTNLFSPVQEEEKKHNKQYSKTEAQIPIQNIQH